MSGDAEKFDEWPGGDAHLDAGSAVKSLATALKRNAALEKALLDIVYFDSTTLTWRCGRHGDADVTDAVGDVLSIKKQDA